MACCGRPSLEATKKKLANQPLVYTYDTPPKQGRCVCKVKGRWQMATHDGTQVRVFACNRGHISPWK